MLLSRNAEDLYWLGRHIERAESVARIVGEHTALLVDLPVDVDSDWGALLAITGASAPFAERYERSGEEEITNFLLADVGNPGSVVRSVHAARECLRVTRSLVPRSGWDCLSSLHATVTDAAAAGAASRSRRSETVESIIGSCQQFTGILEGTMNRDHAYRFWELGRLVERADMTTRVLDVRAGTLMGGVAPAGHPPADRSPYEDVRWLGVLRCVAGQHMYQRSSSAGVDGGGVVSFLLHDPDFPRSVSHCTGRITSTLGALPRRTAPRAAARQLGAMRFQQAPSVQPDAQALHDHVDEVELALADLHDAISTAYFEVDRPEPIELIDAADIRSDEPSAGIAAPTG